MTRRTFFLVGALVAAPLLVAVVVVWYVDEEHRAFRVRDALWNAARELSMRSRESMRGVSQTELEEELTALDRASVSPISFDAAGRPIDAWGTHFRLRPDGPEVVQSAGPDSTFGTADDLSEGLDT